MNDEKMNNVAKQTIVLFKYMDKEMVKKIPVELIEHLQRLAIDSKIKFKYNKEKELDEQDLLEETKDLLAVIFYSYLATESEKKEIFQKWKENENKYDELLSESSSDPFESFKNYQEEKTNNALMVDKPKLNLFSKIKQYINRIFK